MATGNIVTKGIVPEGQTEEQAQKTSTYQMYWDYSEPLDQLKPHRILAINRAEREGALDVTIDVDVEAAVAELQKKADIHNEYHKAAIEDGVVRLLSPAVLREIRSDEADEADEAEEMTNEEQVNFASTVIEAFSDRKLNDEEKRSIKDALSILNKVFEHDK